MQICNLKYLCVAWVKRQNCAFLYTTKNTNTYQRSILIIMIFSKNTVTAFIFVVELTSQGMPHDTSKIEKMYTIFSDIHLLDLGNEFAQFDLMVKYTIQRLNIPRFVFSVQAG